MKSSTLIFRSLAILIFIVGGAQMFSYASYYKDSTNSQVVNTSESNTSQEKVVINTDNSEYETVNQEEVLPIDQLVGKWKVNYNSEDFKGAVIYDLIKTNNKIEAYTIEFQDDKGNGQKADRELTLSINKLVNQKGKGVYKISYEGEVYEVDCKINIIDASTFKLSYDYYGYGDTETWKKL